MSDDIQARLRNTEPKGTPAMINVIVKTVPSDEKTPGPHLNFIQEFDVGQQPYSTDDPRLVCIGAMQEAMELIGRYDVFSVDRDDVKEQLEESEPGLDEQQLDDIAGAAAQSLSEKMDNIGLGDAIDEAADQVLR